MKIKSFFFAFFALAISCAAYSQDSTKMKTTTHHTMAHKHTMHKGMGTKMKTKTMSSTNMSDSTK